MNTCDPFPGCLYCEAPVESFEPGPRGGASQNMTCRACGARYNLAMPSAAIGVPAVPLFLELLAPARPGPLGADHISTDDPEL